jgi:hypothetical protein
MESWTTVRRGSINLHIAYSCTSTNNLFAYNLQFRTEPEFEIRLDLAPNLRSRNKQTSTYHDARELANGAIAQVKLVQLDDRKALDLFASAISRMPQRPETWKLTLHLDRDWSFTVRPEPSDPAGSESLFLYVTAS